MLSDEEKKAIDKLKRSSNYFVMPIYETKIILELIEKQSKEIEELKMITKEYDTFLGNEKIIIADKSYFDNGYFKEKFISKDKIKAKIEEYKELSNNVTMQPQIYSYIVDVLQSLLERSR